MPSSSVEVAPVHPGDRAAARAFLGLPFRLYRGSRVWVPPIRQDAASQIDPRRNPFLRRMPAQLLVALRAGSVVGRLAVFEPTSFNHFHGSRSGFFTLFECEEDQEAAQALFRAAIDWCRERDLRHLQGPRGFSALDGLGLLVRGFEHRPAFGIPYNPAYYQQLLLGCGLVPGGDIVSGYLGPEVRLPDRLLEVGRRVMERRGLRVARFRTRGELLRLAPELGDLYNQSLGGTSGGTPLAPDEVQAIARQMVAFADPRLIKILYKAQQPVGFLFAYPDVSAALQRTGGRLWPFGWLRLVLALRTTRWVNINGAGIAEGHRGLGGTALLFTEMYRSVREGGFEHADLVQIGQENLPMLRELRDFGVDFYKAHRLFEREI